VIWAPGTQIGTG